MRLRLRLSGEDRPREHDVLAERVEDEVELAVDGHEMQAHVTREDGELVVEIDGQRHRVRVEGDREARVDGQRLDFEITDFTPGAGPGETDVLVEAEGRVYPPMQGKILAVNVEEGEEVEAGDVLGTLEAMKMQTDIEAPRAGTVLKVNVEEGEAVDDDRLAFAIGDGNEAE